MKETKELIKFILSLVEAGAKSMEDGKIGFDDVLHFMEALKDALPAFQGLDGIKDELSSMDDLERLDLIAYVKEEFVIPNDRLEAQVEQSVIVLLEILRLLGMFRK